VTDAAAMSAWVDATLLVVSVGQTHGRGIARSLEVLGQVGAPVVGTVLSGTGPTDAYGYGYRYRYYRSALQPAHANSSHVAANGEPRAESVWRP
jgi:receptor protein-tyrosine kinase